MPLWIRWKGHFSPGKVVTELTDHIDLLPTVMGFCGVCIPDSINIDGRSLKPLLTEPFLPENYPNRDQVDRGRPPEKNWNAFSWGKVNLNIGNYKLTIQATKIPGDQVGELYGLKIRYLK